MSLWDSVKSMTAVASAAAMEAGKKAKLKTDILWADRELHVRQRRFGIELYDHVAPLSSQADFWQGSGGDNAGAMDDRLMDAIRPALLETQREIAVMELRLVQQKEKISQAEVTRQAAFPKKAETFGEKVLNAGVAAGYAGNSAKLNAELAMTEAQIKGHKEEFGIRMYRTFSDLEDTQGWLPTDRHIRAMYDQTRRDLEQIELKRASIESELTGQAPPASKSVSINATPATPRGGYVMNTGVAVAATPATTSSFGGFYSTPQTPTPTSYGSTVAAHPSYQVTTPSWATSSSSAPQPSWSVPSSLTPAYPSPAPTYSAADPFASTEYAVPTAPPQPYDPFSLYAAPPASTNRTYRQPPPPSSDLLDFTYNN